MRSGNPQARVDSGRCTYLRSGVAGSLLGELHAGAESEFGVDVGEVGLHGARGDEKPRGDVVVGEPFADQSYDVALGGGERGPAGARPFALAATALGVRDRFFDRQRGALGPRGFKVLLAHPLTKCRHWEFEKGVEDLEADKAAALPDSVCGAE